MTGIFINYRREDTGYAVDRIYDWLRRAFGEEVLFRDIAQIGAGADFEAAIDRALAESSVILTVIGREWLNLKEDGGGRRIDAKSDYVRYEIEAALRKNMNVMPLLLDGVSIPRARDLPKSIRTLAKRNHFMLRPDPEFADNMNRLILELSKNIGIQPRKTLATLEGFQATDPRKLEEWIHRYATRVEGAPPLWRFRTGGRAAFCQCQQTSDLSIDRMRVVAPVISLQEAEQKGVRIQPLLERILVANYHSALDPRYAIDDSKVIVAAFLHPLSTLSEGQFLSALQQVAEMVWTFGTSYSSSELIFARPG